MTALLLDASVWLAALDRDDAFHTEAAELIQATVARGASLAALDVTLYEVATVASARWGAPADAARLCRLVLTACSGTVVHVDEDLLRQAVEIAAERGIPVTEAAHVACAGSRGWTLVTTDVGPAAGRGHDTGAAPGHDRV